MRYFIIALLLVGCQPAPSPAPTAAPPAPASSDQAVEAITSAPPPPKKRWRRYCARWEDEDMPVYNFSGPSIGFTPTISVPFCVKWAWEEL